MNDNIDEGEIISQVKIHNNKNIPLKLLYQICFLAELEAFKIAFNRNFLPIKKQDHNLSSYFKRADENMKIDFAQDSKDIINKIQAFNIPNQLAFFFFKKQKIYVSEAKIITNTFLSHKYRYTTTNTIILIYEDCILVKRKKHFLELKIINQNHIFEIGDHLLQPQEISIYQTHQYTFCSDQKIFEFSYKKNEKLFYNICEISPIPHTPFFDMSSPYGYSGYYLNNTDINFLKEAIEEQSLQAKKHNIIAEFIRFNPYINQDIFASLLDFYTMEKQMVEVTTNSTQRWSFYSSRLKNKIRKSLSLLKIQRSYDLKKFSNLYTQTMQRNQAQDFYYFDETYFKKLANLKGFIMFEALYNNQTCAMAIFLCDKNRSYYHLGANSIQTIQNNLNAMGAIFETFFQYAEKNNIISCLLGGGRTTDVQDNLLLYKKQFSPSLVNFYIGGKIYNKEVYQQLSSQYKNSLFLKYRFPSHKK